MFDFLSADGDDLGHALRVSNGEGEILRLRLRMTAHPVIASPSPSEGRSNLVVEYGIGMPG